MNGNKVICDKYLVVFARFSTEMHGVDVKDCTKVKKTRAQYPAISNKRLFKGLNYVKLFTFIVKH